MGDFRTFLEYKAKWYQRSMVIAPSHYASAQLCSHCEYQNKEIPDLKVREKIYPQSDRKYDQDINSVKNRSKMN